MNNDFGTRVALVSNICPDQPFSIECPTSGPRKKNCTQPSFYAPVAFLKKVGSYSKGGEKRGVNKK